MPTEVCAGCGVSVVVITRDRRASLQHTLDRLLELPERPEVVVVDNGSTDGTAAAVADRARRDGDRLRLVRLHRNVGAPARNIGVARARGAVIAFCDDDAWWAPGALAEGARLLAAHPSVGLLAGRVVLHPTGVTDPVSRKMAAAPLGTAPGAPGPSLLSFPAFAAVVRRSAFEAAGGFSRLLFFGGEERLLALDLARAGWQLCYRDELVVHHAAAGGPVRPARWAQHQRNDALVDWLRRPLPRAVSATARLARQALTDPVAARAVGGVLLRLPVALAARRPVAAGIDAALTAEDRPLAALLRERDTGAAPEGGAGVEALSRSAVRTC